MRSGVDNSDFINRRKAFGGFEVSSLVQGFWMSLAGHHTISGFRPLKLPVH